MSGSYGQTLRTPGALRVFVPSILGRLAFAMGTLSVIVLVSRATGSFASAGIVSGVFGLVNVVVAPYRASLVSRVGHRLGLRGLSVGFAIGLMGIAVTVSAGAPLALTIASAALTGASAPPVGAAMRLQWRRLVGDAEGTGSGVGGFGSGDRPDDAPEDAADDTVAAARVGRAYSLDSVSEEVVFTLGPVAAGAVMALTVPVAGVLVCAGLALVGCFGMTTQRADPPVGAPRPDRGPDAPRQQHLLRRPGFVAGLLVTAATGVVVGAVDVIVPAQTAPDEGLSGILLGALAAGSAVGGLAYGARVWRSSPRSRLFVLGGAMAIACALLPLLPPVALLVAGLAVTGLFLAPATVSGYLVVDELVDDAGRLQAHTWIAMAINGGAATASAVGGFAIESLHPAGTYLLSAGLAAVLVASGGILAVLSRRAPRDPGQAKSVSPT